jgi:hypothetical protein
MRLGFTLHRAYYQQCFIDQAGNIISIPKENAMAHQILQVNFKFTVPRAQFENAASSVAQAFADVPGCVWKVFLMNEAESEAGGIYLFADEASVENYKSSPLFASVLSNPAFSDHAVKQFEVMEDVSRITRAPLTSTAAAA